MLRRQFLAVMACAAVLGPARAAAQTKAQRLVLATATPGGGFQAYGAALIAAIRSAEPALDIEERATGGSAENIELLRTGRVF